MIVILRPLGKNPWSGLIRYRNCHEDLGSYFTRTGRLYTGLSKTDEQRLGDILGYDLSPVSDFWKTFFIRTGAKDLYLDTREPMDELRYIFLKSHKRVSPSIFERRSGANFVLINKDEEAKKSNLFNKNKRKALKEFDKLTKDDIVRCLRLYGHSAENVSPDVAENMLFDIVEGNPQGFLDKWVDNADRETEYLVEKAIASNVLRRNKNVYKYGTDIIGHSLEDTVAYLKEPKNQDLRFAIMKAVDSKVSIVEPPSGEDDEVVEVKKSRKKVQIEEEKDEDDD